MLLPALAFSVWKVSITFLGSNGSAIVKTFRATGFSAALGCAWARRDLSGGIYAGWCFRSGMRYPWSAQRDPGDSSVSASQYPLP